MFEPVGSADFPKLEQEVADFWRAQDIFQKSLEKPTSKGDYIFLRRSAHCER